jgi:putative transposase
MPPGRRALATLQNAFAESLIGPLPDECLDEHVFAGLPAARPIIEAWYADYSAYPQTSVRRLTPPNEFATRSRTDYNQNGSWL